MDSGLRRSLGSDVTAARAEISHDLLTWQDACHLPLQMGPSFKSDPDPQVWEPGSQTPTLPYSPVLRGVGRVGLRFLFGPITTIAMMYVPPTSSQAAVSGTRTGRGPLAREIRF